MKEKQTSFIVLTGDITEDKSSRLISLCLREIQKHGAETLYFMVSSAGGEVEPGVTLYNFLKSLPVEIVMHGIGNIDSITTVIFSAGDRRYATPGSSFLFHGVKNSSEEGSEMTLAEAEDAVDKIRKDEDRVAEILAKETRMTRAELAGMFRKDEAKTVDYGIKKGMVHDVRPCKIPKGARILHIA